MPFPALFDRRRGRFVVQDHDRLLAPTLELYLSSRRSAPFRQPRRVLAIGDPAFDIRRFPKLCRLSFARKEALAVAALYPDYRYLLDGKATQQQILNWLPGREVLHLAAHVVVDPRNPLRSLIATADSDGPPLRASDLDAQHLAGVELVFLSACDTAPGFADGDREGVAGLARAFLASGVPSVVATLWPVEDEDARPLAVAFHRHLTEGTSPVRALRLAQIDSIASSSSTTSSWASFQLFSGR